MSDFFLLVQHVYPKIAWKKKNPLRYVFVMFSVFINKAASKTCHADLVW